MPERRALHNFDYVNHSYDQVRTTLLADPAEVFRRATRAGAASGAALGPELRVKVAGVELATDIAIEVRDVAEATSPLGKPATKIAIAWHAGQHAGMFPSMVATLSVYALSSTETQLELTGTYAPPFGVVGDALDAIAMHRLAEASVAGFLKDVAAFLRGGATA